MILHKPFSLFFFIFSTAKMIRKMIMASIRMPITGHNAPNGSATTFEKKNTWYNYKSMCVYLIQKNIVQSIIYDMVISFRKRTWHCIHCTSTLYSLEKGLLRCWNYDRQRENQQAFFLCILACQPCRQHVRHVPVHKGFVNVFSRRATGNFHKWAKLLELNFFVRKMLC